MIKWVVPIFCCALLIMSFASCKKRAETTVETTQNYPIGSKLSRIVLYESETTQVPIGIVADYEYDSQDRIRKISRPFLKDGIIDDITAYEIYLYNDDNQIVEIQNYNKSLKLGYLLLKKSSFLYDAKGNKIKELEYFPQIHTTETKNYYYEAGRLRKIDHLNPQNQLTHYIIYDYNPSGKLVKETLFESDSKMIQYTVYTYADDKNVLTTVYNQLNNTAIRQINKSFDRFGNLVVLSSKELSLLSSMSNYTHRYEYIAPPAIMY